MSVANSPFWRWRGVSRNTDRFLRGLISIVFIAPIQPERWRRRDRGPGQSARRGAASDTNSDTKHRHEHAPSVKFKKALDPLSHFLFHHWRLLASPSNALPLSCGRAPQATDRQLQRLVGRLSNQESEPQQTAIAVRGFRAPGVTAHLFFLPEQKVTPGSGLAERLRQTVATFPIPNSTPSTKSVQRFAVKLRAAVCGRPSASTACSAARP